MTNYASSNAYACFTRWLVEGLATTQLHHYWRGVMSRASASSTGTCHISSTCGKAKPGTYNENSNGHLIVQSNAQRTDPHIPPIDRRVGVYQRKPFCVGLVDQLLLPKRPAATARRTTRQTRGRSQAADGGAK
jgi:hypothetical protein